MRKLFWQISTTLDGFMEGPDHDLSDTAMLHDPDFERYAGGMLRSIDDIVIGRRTYDGFAGYWPSATGPDAERMNTLPKLVFSRSGMEVNWSNARVASDVVSEITRLKERPGRDIALFGSANLAASLAREGLIDEYRILVTPVVLGRGHRAFPDHGMRTSLQLTKEERWSTGTLALFYQVTS